MFNLSISCSVFPVIEALVHEGMELENFAVARDEHDDITGFFLSPLEVVEIADCRCELALDNAASRLWLMTKTASDQIKRYYLPLAALPPDALQLVMKLCTAGQEMRVFFPEVERQDDGPGMAQ